MCIMYIYIYIYYITRKAQKGTAAGDGLINLLANRSTSGDRLAPPDAGANAQCRSSENTSGSHLALTSRKKKTRPSRPRSTPPSPL